jgi:Rod binding domain-containing protein
MDIQPVSRHGGQRNPVPEPDLTRLTPQEQEDLKKLKELSIQFEGIFMNQLMQAMRDTVPKTGYLGNGMGEEMFTSLLDMEYANQMSRSGGSDIATNLYKQMAKVYLQNSASKK